MSMGGFPIELDQLIVEHLHDRSDLSRMSQVSKYYRAITEPFLYRNISFSLNQGINFKYLYFALRERKYLAKYIRRLEYHAKAEELVGTTSQQPSHVVVDLDDAIRNDMPELQAVVHYDSLPSGWSAERLRDLVYGVDYTGYMHLILRMASNIKSLHVPYFTRPNNALDRMHSSKKGVGPFCNLQDLNELSIESLAEEDDIFVNMFRGLETLRICGEGMVSGMTFPPSQHPVDSTLKRLTITGVYLEPRDLSDAFTSPWLRGLQDLHVFGTKLIYNGEDDVNDSLLPWFTTSMEKHLPHLRSFVWADVEVLLARMILGPFVNFKNLVTLVLDHYFLAPDLSVIGLVKLFPSCPPTLETLTLQMDWVDIEELCEPYFDIIDAPTSTWQERVKAESTHRTQSFTIILDLIYTDRVPLSRALSDPNLPTGLVLERLIDVLSKEGTKMEVWAVEPRDGVENQMVLGPGYESPYLSQKGKEVKAVL